MSIEDMADAEEQDAPMPVAIRESQIPLVPTHETVKSPITAAQAKIEAVANLTAAAYAKASELRLTPEEITALQADFPDEAFKPGAAGKETLLYIEHAFLRDRLNQVIGPGQWALIPRSRWAEDFTTAKGQPASRVYCESMLMVRGCFVAEAVGEMEYWKNNASQNYGDAVEGAKTAALRRCCKEFGIGLQAWKKDWCAGWWARKNASARQTTTQPISHPRSPAPPPTPAPAPKPEPKVEPKLATEATRNWMIEHLTEFRDIAEEYFRAINQLLPNEHIEELPLECVPVSKAQLDLLKTAIQGFQNGDPAERAFPPNLPLASRPPINVGTKHGESQNDDTTAQQPWYNVIVPIPRKGMKRDDYLKAPDTIGSLYEERHGTDDMAQEARKRLWGFVTNYEPKGWTKRDGTVMPPSDSDKQFRDYLDQFAAWFEKTHPNEKL